MTKEVYIALIQKDIRELDLLAHGLYENETPSPTLVKLASAKAQEVIDNLQKLATIKNLPANQALPKEVFLEEIKAEEIPIIVETPVVEEKIIEEIAVSAIEPINSVPEPDVVPNEEVVAVQKEETKTEKVELAPTQKPIEKVVPRLNTQTETKLDGLSKAKDNSLASSLSNKKITDIKQAISIADRFRFQRELFNNNGDKMNECLSKLNASASLSEAESYLLSFNWKSENETVTDFMVIVNRLFV